MTMGVLSRRTFVYTEGGVTLTLERATIVLKEDNKIYFNEHPELVIYKHGEDYIAMIYDQPNKIVFPKGTDRLPYPISLLS